MNAINRRGYQDVPMTRRRAQLLAEYANKLADMLEAAPDNRDLAEWVQSKIDRAADQIQSAYHYLDQEDDDELEKAVGHKYTHRKRVGTDKRGRARYRYYYAEHQGGGISRASFEAGSAFKLTWQGRRGHFHIDRVEGDQVFITHDSRPNMEPVAISKGELRALLKRQHGKAEQEHVEKRRKEVEKIKSRNVKRGLGLALHRLRQAAQVAGVELDERYQRKPKKRRKPAQVTDTPREDRFDTMPEVEDLANKKTFRERSLALRGYKPEELIEIAAHAFIQDKAVNKEADAKARELKREYEILSNTAARLGSEEELAKEGGLYRYQDAEQATREKHEEILNLSRIDTYNKVYRDVISHLRDQKTNYVERRNAIEGRIKELNLSTDSFETAPATTPTNGTALTQNVLGAAEEAQRLDAQGGSKRSATAIEADERLIETIKTLISNEYQDVEDVTRSDRPPRQWTVKERELNRLTDSLETLQSAKRKTRSMTEATAQSIREATRSRLINEMRSRIATDSRIKPPTPRNELTETAQQIIEDANQEHEERHEEHQEITKFELGEHTHTKTGAKLFTAKQKERTDRDEYFRRVEIAKKHGGRYERRYVRGFVFKSAEDARAFALEVEGAAQEAPETSAETVTPHEDHPSADNFETMPEVESAPRSKTPAPKTRADLAKLIHQELLSAGFKGANLWIRNEGTDREKARIYLSGKGRKQGMIEALSSQEYGSEGAFRLQVIQEEGLDGASEKEIQEAIDRRASALDLKLTPPKLDPKQLQRYLEAISAVARKLKDSAPKILDPSDRPVLALTLDYTETPLAQRSREELETLRTKAQQVNSRESRPQDRNENTHAVSVAQHIIREVNIALGETTARTTQPPTTPREQLTETAREVTPTRTAHTIVLDRLLEAKRSGNEAQESQVNEQLRPQLMSLLEKLEQGTLDDGERQALLSRYQELQTLTTGAAQELAQEIVSRLQGADNFETMPEVEAPEKGEAVQDERFEYGLELEALAKRAGLKYSEQGVTRSADARLVRDNEPRVLMSAPQLQKVYPKLTQEQVNDFKARAIAYLKEFTGDDLTEDIQHTAQSNQTRSRMIYKELDATISHIINEVGRGGREERKATLQAVKMLADWREGAQPTPSPAREQLTETVRELSDQPARTAAVRSTPRASEATLTSSGELSGADRANLIDRARFITSGSEEATKTGRRSRGQKAKDQELLLIYNRLHSDASARLGPLAPRFADYSQFVKLQGGDLPERAQTRADFRAGIMSSIEELRNATTAQKSAHHMINYRAQLLQTIERIA